jgi:hypothetical protein
MHPILSMAYWLRDAQASIAVGRSIFNLPYPGGSWIEEKQRNDHLLHLMNMAWNTAVLGFKVQKGEKLTKDEDELLDLIAEYL